MKVLPLLALALLLAPGAGAAGTAGLGAGDGGCIQRGEDHICWDGSTDTAASQQLGPLNATAETYTARRDGSGSGSYTVVRDGVRVGAGSPAGFAVVDLQQVDYDHRRGPERVREREVRLSAGDDDVSVGFRRTDFGAVAVCDLVVESMTLRTPCAPVYP